MVAFQTMIRFIRTGFVLLLLAFVTILICELLWRLILSSGLVAGVSRESLEIRFQQQEEVVTAWLSKTTGEKPPVQSALGNSLAHPYLGFYATNRSLEAETFELIRNASQKSNTQSFKVLLLGGSVANMLYRPLYRRFQDLISTRELTMLNASYPAFGEPQQLIAFNYVLAMGYSPDLVINIDGVNDIGSPRHDLPDRDIPLSFPQVWDLFIKDNLSTRELILLGELSRIRKQQKDLIEIFKPISSTSSFGLTIWNVLHTELEIEFLRSNEQLLSEENHKKVYHSYFTDSMKRAFQDEESRGAFLVNLWSNSTQIIAEIANQKRIRYFHILQPSPHVKDGKVLTQEEEGFDSPRFTLHRSTRRWYPVMRERGKLIEKLGANFVDMSYVFREEPFTVYVDSCCHMNEYGNSKFADAIAMTITESLPINDSVSQ